MGIFRSDNSYGFIRGFCDIARRMSPLIKLLLEGGKLNTAQMAQVLNLPETEVNRQLEQLRADRVLLGWRPVLNLADEDTGIVRRVRAHQHAAVLSDCG